MRSRRVLATLAAVALLGLTGCGGASGARDSGDARITGPVTVFAAASLTGTFTTLGREFEAAHPGVRVSFNFAGSSALAAQINQGAPADVFASAAPTTMDTVTAAGNADGPPTTFARNQLVIAVPKGNPAGIAGLTDLARPDVKVAVCTEQVPCGTAARKVLDAADVELTPVTLERDVRAALAKVKLGEVDAALVYRTDTRAAAAEVDGVEFAGSAAAVNDYPIVAVKRAPNPAGGRAFVGYVLSDRGRAVLTAAGFQPPPGS